MKLDVNALRYLSREDFKVLRAVEMGMTNHELVPAELVDRIAHLSCGGTYKVMKNLLKHKLLHHDSSKYDGFRLTYLGYDFLAIKTLVNRGVFSAVGRQIGVGKESDIFEVATEDGTILAMKLHRLGRTSFRAVKSKRDYLRRRSSHNWLYMSRLAALKEYAFMKALEENDFPVPTAVDCNRHCVIMSLVQGYPLVQVKQLQNPDEVFDTIIGLVVRLAEHGLIHCDFNEFNIMIDDDEKITMIDFPQMISVSHRNAKMYFDRDVECIFKFFRKRFNLSVQEKTDACDGSGSDIGEPDRPSFSSIAKTTGLLDKQLEASGFTNKEQDEIEKFTEGGTEQKHSGGSDDDDDDEPTAYNGQGHDEYNDDAAKKFDSLHLEDQNVSHAEGDTTERLPQIHGLGDTNNAEHEVSEREANMNYNDKKGSGDDSSCILTKSNEHESSLAAEKDDNGDPSDDDDPLLTKRLSKQRRKAVAAARGGQKSLSSRNSYKDKGGKASQNSKAQREACNW
ncbi:serine/threonine-protein kinase rio2 [Iris pallida]|uniref:Serine/threonine-protein kinase RIO2 n=1 Tax=Iris pallida TaxID=29817 RepID=A0AAX6FJG6_IRIPA|nr:serine/threonine-protein kinase rio2 [Iris pallida]